jgi:hypothetical protein
VSAVTKKAKAVRVPLAASRLRPGTSDARADRRVAAPKSAMKIPSDHG